MNTVSKLSIALLLGASITACSENTDTEAPAVTPTEAPTTQKAEESHEGHAHNEPVKLTSAAIATANELFQQDVHYRVLETAFTADNNQVHEFFWYGCPACKATEPLMQKLKANDKLKVEVKSSLLNEKWVFDAVIFEAFKHFNVLEKAHPAYFEARQNGTVKDQASFEKFLTDQGIKLADFDTFAQSNAMKATLDASHKIESKLKSTGVPTLVVGGKYVILNRGFNNVDDMQKAIEWLTEK
ncbi:MAG: thioredoxin domain-containing protein [Alteromonadales bacterium]|nr:thioredoxin domain-containing protein [Alteromonadales bacterium]